MKKLFTVLTLMVCSLALTSRVQAQPACNLVTATGPVDMTSLDDDFIEANDGVGPSDMACITVNVGSGFFDANQGSFLQMSMHHTWVGDVVLRAYPPAGCAGAGGNLDFFSLMTRPQGDDITNPPPDNSGCCGDSSDLGVDQGAPTVLDFVCDGSGSDPETLGLGLTGTTVIPNTTLNPNPDNIVTPGNINCAALENCDATGTWTFCAGDGAAGDLGTIDGAGLLVCQDYLPVELTRFDAVLNDDVALLSWETATEDNNAGFEVQREIAPELFETLGFVEGAGSTLEAQSYTFRATDLGYGTHRFRLKQIDYDGQFEYSEIVEVTRELAEGYLLSPFYPNPFNPRGTFTLFLARDQQVKIEVYNIMGQLVDVVAQRYLAAQQTYTFDFTADGSLPSGHYILQVTGELFAGNQRITLLK